jgi:hypothetical protein
VGSTTVGLSYGQERKSATCTLFIGVDVHGSDKESVHTHGRAWTAEKVCVHDTPAAAISTHLATLAEKSWQHDQWA